jgi:flagellar protein FliS
MDARSSYREAAVRGATPVQLIVLLYEQAIEDLRRAVLAVIKGDIEGRTRTINHALAVIGQLQFSLDMERGGEVAKNLERFYKVARTALMEAQLAQSASLLEEQIAHLMLLREAWMEVERTTATPESLPREAAQAAPGISLSSSPETSCADWNA